MNKTDLLVKLKTKKDLFSEEDLDFNDNLPIIMTEKDAVRCLEMKNKNLWYLSIEANFEETELAEKILTKIAN